MTHQEKPSSGLVACFVAIIAFSIASSLWGYLLGRSHVEPCECKPVNVTVDTHDLADLVDAKFEKMERTARDAMAIAQMSMNRPLVFEGIAEKRFDVDELRLTALESAALNSKGCTCGPQPTPAKPEPPASPTKLIPPAVIPVPKSVVVPCPK